jgi:hypothetical protein
LPTYNLLGINSPPLVFVGKLSNREPGLIPGQLKGNTPTVTSASLGLLNSKWKSLVKRAKGRG